MSEVSGKEGAAAARAAMGGSTDECIGRSLEQLSDAFSSSARRWELVVYPALLAFIILAAYGFYLIYSLTDDVAEAAGHMAAITGHMEKVSQEMAAVSTDMRAVAVDFSDQRGAVHEMVAELRKVNSNISDMNASVDHMTVSVAQMSNSMDQVRYHMGQMNHNVSRPMNFMNSFMPW